MALTSPDAWKRQLTRRLLLVGGLQGMALAGLATRMGYLQFVKSDQYRTLSEENRIKLQIVPPVRGEILDRNGEILAGNKPNYRLFLERDQRKVALETLDKLRDLLGFDEAMYANLREQVRTGHRHRPLLVLEHMTWDQLAETEFHLIDLPAATLDEGQLRSYPLSEKAAHLIGYIGRVSPEEVEEDPSLKRMAEFKIGKGGVELRDESTLRGKAGKRQLEVNATGMAVRELANQPYEQGDALPLTIDKELQLYAADLLGEESGSIVVMDAHFGEVLALVSMPAFDPNAFSMGIRADYWNSLLANERNPLLNKALAGIYPPASTFKMIVGLAGLRAGVIRDSTRFFCPGHYQLGNRRFNCWKAGGHGHVNLTEAIAESCDTYFYNVGNQIGIEAITDMAAQFGFGAPSELNIAGEKSGLLPSPEWKKRIHAIPWVKGDTINASIGQGYMLATPMQLAIMTARIASGLAVSPTLRERAGASQAQMLDVDASHLDLVRTGMNMVSNMTFGTGYGKRITQKGMEMAGKTGTAQVRRITQRGVDQNTLPWRFRHHGMFVGYAPVHNPRFVASVVVDHGGGGSSAAAPLARDVLYKVQQLAADNPRRFKG